MYQCGGRNVTQSFCTNSSMYDFSNLPIGGTKTCKKRGCFYSCHEWTLIMEMFESLLSELGFHFGLGSVFFHLNISRHMWIVVLSPKTFLIAIVLMVLTSLVRDLQASEVWQKLPSQELIGHVVAWDLMYENLLVKRMKISSDDKPIDLFTGAMCFFVHQQVLNLYTLGFLG